MTFDNSSSNASEKHYIPYFVPVWWELVIYVCLATVGLIGNTTTCIIIASNKSMHTATNFYLFNLAVSDLMILFWDFPMYCSLTTTIEILCQTRIQLAITSVHVTILTISVFSVERYMAICHPFLASEHLSSPSHTLKTIPLIWLVGFICALPIALQFGLMTNPHDPTEVACTFTNGAALYFGGIASLIFFVIPMILIGTMYVFIGLRIKTSATSIRSTNAAADQLKQRAPKMLMVVVVAFFICWAPVYIERVLFTISALDLIDDAIIKYMSTNFLIDISQFLYYSSSIINPILYNIMSRKFRGAFKSTISRCCIVEYLTRHSSLWSSERKSSGRTKTSTINENLL